MESGCSIPPSCGELWDNWVGEGPGGHLCSPSGVYMVDCTVRESMRGRGEEN